MGFFKHLKFEILFNLLKTKRLLIIPFIYLLDLYVIRISFINSEMFGDVTMLDYWIYLFNAGDPLIYTDDKALPFMYLSKIFITLFIVIGYIEDKLRGYNLQLIVREPSKKLVWRVYICAGMCYAFACEFLYIVTTILFCLFNGAQIKLSITPQLINDIYDSQYYELRELYFTHDIIDYIMLLILPLVCMCALISLYMLFSLMINSVIAFVILNFLCVLSMYGDFPVLQSIYVMINRSDLIVDGGANSVLLCFISFFIILISVFVGEILFWKKDMLGKERNNLYS